MDLFSLCVFSFVFFVSSFCHAAAEITLNPPSVKLLGKSNHKPLTINCAPPSDAGIERLISLTIRRNATNMPQDLASAYSEAGNGTARNLSKLNGTTVSGSIDDQNITFTMPVLSCVDDGLYICDAVYLKSINSAPVTSTDQKHLAVRALPGAITMTSVDQNGDQVLTAGTKLELICEGFVGDEEDRSEVTWKWQYEVHDGVAFHDYESTDDIDNGPITQDPDVPCQRRQTSRLTRTLTPDDSGRRYRCLVRLGSIDFTGQAAYHTLGEVSGKAGEVSSEGDDSPNAGEIAGIVIGVVLACAAAAGMLFYYRRRRQAEQDRTAQTNGPASDVAHTVQEVHESAEPVNGWDGMQNGNSPMAIGPANLRI